jgi:type II secretory ATPase GspE/PulE/Tfp pilus assembly ATPase PilB-like protein
VVLVGEIRDFETAEIAIKAALTGHLVLSTLHTNGAPETITRLMNMGIEPFLVATSVHLICAQRLVRRICKECAENVEVPVQTLIEEGFTPEEAKTVKIQKGKVGVQQHRIQGALRSLRSDGSGRRDQGGSGGSVSGRTGRRRPSSEG